MSDSETAAVGHDEGPDREYKLENHRRCELCKEEIDGGLEAVAEHIEDEHDLVAVAKQVSHQWRPFEPLAFHAPNGTVHFVKSSGYGIETRCGLEHTDLDEPEKRERTNYEHAEAENYCGNCTELAVDFNGPNYLPEPLLEAR